ncbi:MAG: hypothetical protein IPO77_21800 [Acidobacteria bacterium]|nr:hypothetical protein [Acidobacteriota bacterium]
MPTGSMPSESIRVTQNVAPSLFSVTKAHSGSPSSQVTGPNYPRTYTITANMPAGLTATNIVIEDVLPNRIVYQGVSGAGISVISQPAIGSVVTPPNNLLKISVPASGVPITVNFYVPENDSSGSPIIDPLSGAPSTTDNQATATGTWLPIDPRDRISGGPVMVSGNRVVTITNRSLELTKSVINPTPPTSPGDELTYTLLFQVSDYFTVRDLVIVDVMSDGQDFLSSFTPVLNVTDRAGNVTGGISAAYYTVVNDAPSVGKTRITFDVSQAMIALGAADGTLQGGRSITPDAGPAQGTITFKATVRDLYKAPPMGPLVTGDSIDNGASITGGVVANNNINSISTGTVPHDSVISLGLEVPQIIKSIYAVNGSLSLPNPLRIMPGDLVTFRLRYNIPTGDYKSVKITDTLPLPTYEAETLTNLSFNNINTGIPATGNAQFGPANSGAPLVDVPGITISNSLFNNQITFSFPDKSDPPTRRR